MGIGGALATPGWRSLAHDPGTPAGVSPEVTPFVDPLPIPAESVPVMQGRTRIHTLVMRAGLARLHRDLPRTVV